MSVKWSANDTTVISFYWLSVVVYLDLFLFLCLAAILVKWKYAAQAYSYI